MAEILTIPFIVSILIAIVGLATGFRETRRLKTAIKKSADSLKGILFDEVTGAIFDNLKRNHRLTFRMNDVDVKEKQNLGDVLCGSTDQDGSQNLMAIAIAQLTEKDRVSIFVESGSTLAYLFHRLCNKDFFKELGSSVRIKTNNVLVNLTCVFKDKIAVRMLDGKPVGRYGASFGQSVPPDEPEDFVKLWRANCRGKRVVDDYPPYKHDEYYLASLDQYQAMKAGVSDFLGTQEGTDLIVMTASMVSLFDGPHVGSFQNRDFKEILYGVAVKHKIPLLFVLYDDKIHEEPMNKGCVPFGVRRRRRRTIRFCFGYQRRRTGDGPVCESNSAW